MADSNAAQPNEVVCAADCEEALLESLLSRFGLSLVRVASHRSIPGSFWGDSEAGLVGDRIYFRSDTPLHSILHESSHYICMDPQRRAALDRDAGGDHSEENAVCYLQILLADLIPGVGRERMCRDMDAWGYTFRLGSASAWFEQDAGDARAWLQGHGLIDGDERVTWRLSTRFLKCCDERPQSAKTGQDGQEGG